MNIGYACQNMELSNLGKGKRVTMNRSCIRRTYDDKGVDYISELTLKNAYDLEKLLHWNEEHNIKFFRLSSDICPWASEFDMNTMKDIKEIKQVLARAGAYAQAHSHRLTSHPGQFNVLCSPNPNVVERSITDLTIHGTIFDWMNLPRSPYAKINIHLGGAYGDKESSMKRFCEAFQRLPDRVKTRLTVENDDKASMYSVKDLYHGVYEKIGIPIVFDYHHHRFCTGDLTEQAALELAISTWPDDVVPVVHYSESRSIEQEDPKLKPQAHSDYVYDYIDTYGNKVDVMVEAKAKELAVKKYKELHYAC
jgi:UV DNA damage endonuclease